jgi:transcriptional regulator with XRE-family HTH domain
MQTEPQRHKRVGGLGGFIAERRMAAGLSQRQLAARTGGLHHSLLARIESGEVERPSVEHLQRIADALELDVSDLLAYLGAKPHLPEPRAYFRRKLGMNAHEADVLAQLVEDFQTNQHKK